jgi:hypothetical protein
MSETEKPTRIDEMRKLYIEHHEGATPGGGWWSNPGGVVIRNINTEGAGRQFDLLSTRPGSPMNVTGGWPT